VAGEFIAEGERSDVVHDLLAHLAEEMIRMNKEKQEEIRGFLTWLEEFMGAKVDDLSNKTKVMAYYEIEFGELLSVLKKNKRKLGVDPSRRAFMKTPALLTRTSRRSCSSSTSAASRRTSL
jgi:hypothetical protein